MSLLGWKRTLVAYLAGYVAMSAGTAITTRSAVALQVRIMEPTTDPAHGALLYAAGMGIFIAVNSVPFFLGGTVVAAVVARRGAWHAALFGLGLAGVGFAAAVIWLLGGDRGKMLAAGYCVAFALVAAAAAAAGGKAWKVGRWMLEERALKRQPRGPE